MHFEKIFMEVILPMTILVMWENFYFMEEAAMKALNLNYFYGNEAEQFNFYRIPKILFTDRRYKAVSMEAKVLYGLMLDRMNLSIRNGWLDSDGKVYIYFTLEDAIEFLGFGKDKLVKLFKELDWEGGIGLIERRKQGQGKPTKIYVKNFILSQENEPLNSGEPKSGSECEVLTSEKSKSDLQCEVLTSEKPKSNLRCEVLTSENTKSRLLNDRSADCGNSASNNTDMNNTEFSDTESIYPPHPLNRLADGGGRQRVRMDEIDLYRETIRENIGYECLLEEYPYDRELIDGYVELIVEVCCTQREYIRVNQENMPRDLVKSRLLKLDREHIRYVMDCLSRNKTRIENIKAYTLSSLYNAPITMNQHYISLVSHDMAQDMMVQ